MRRNAQLIIWWKKRNKKNTKIWPLDGSRRQKVVIYLTNLRLLCEFQTKPHITFLSDHIRKIPL